MSKVDDTQSGSKSEGNDEKVETKVVSKVETSDRKYPVLVLMGDSVLDNFFWLTDKTTDLEKVLDKTFNKKADIINLAVDESTVKDVLRGKTPSLQYVHGRRKNNLKPYPVQASGKVEPLKNMKDMIDSGVLQHKKSKNKNKKDDAISITKSDPTMKPTVILSAGGNNFREALVFGDSGGSVKDILTKVANSGLQDDYVQLLEQLTQDEYLSCNVIMVIVYEPHRDWLGKLLPREQLLQMLDWGVKQFLTLAEIYSIPVIDLSRTFDPFDRSHYGSTEIEPSDLSQQFICDLIYHVVHNFDFDDVKKQSTVYYGLKADKNGIVKEPNNEKTRGLYLEFVKKREPKL